MRRQRAPIKSGSLGVDLTTLAHGDSQQFFQVLSADLSIAQDAFQNLGVEDLRGVIWNRGPFACGIPLNLVAATLPSQGKSKPFLHRGHLAGCDAGQLRH